VRSYLGNDVLKVIACPIDLMSHIFRFLHTEEFLKLLCMFHAKRFCTGRTIGVRMIFPLTRVLSAHPLTRAKSMRKAKNTKVNSMRHEADDCVESVPFFRSHSPDLVRAETPRWAEVVRRSGAQMN
jgi:hypothetical protein